jgi:tight adherence protein B
MNPVAISIMSGALIGVALYLSFDEIWARVGTRFKAITDKTLESYNDMHYSRDRKRVLQEQFAVSGGLALLAILLFMKSPAVAISMALVGFWQGWGAVYAFLEKSVRPKRISVFSNQMVDGLTLMANAMKSGMNLSQALDICVKEMSGPISQEFKTILDKNRIGQSIENGLDTLARRLPCEDVQMFVTSVNILKETGGNMAETFQTITKVIRERLKLQNKIAAMTAQGMMSAYIVSCLPWCLATMLYFVDPEMMTPLFVTIPGWVVLAGVLTLEIIGFVIIKKIVTIRV